jgi:hypothetical protein
MPDRPTPQAPAARRQRGSIVVYLVVGLVAFGVLAMAGATRFSSVVSSVFSPNCATSARYMAESGQRYAMARLRACADEACVTAAASAMNGQTITVDAAKGLSFSLAVTYNATEKTASVTSTGKGCTNITGVSKAVASSINLPALTGSGDINFNNLEEGFTITTPTGSNTAITVDPSGKLVFLGVLGETFNSGAIWYTGNNTFCTNGSCTMDYGLRAYFETQWDTSSIADGIVFGIKSALTNAVLSAGGDPYKDMGEVMGWAGPGPSTLGVTGIKPPKIGLELDTWRNNNGTPIYNADSRADMDYDPSTANDNRNSDHAAFVFWGSQASTSVPIDSWPFYINTATYDDNRHAQTFTDTGAGAGTNTEPKSYVDLNGTGDGRWGYYYRPANSIWLRDGTRHLVRFELTRFPGYTNASSNYPYLLKAWVRDGAQANSYSDVTANYTANPPNLSRAIFLSKAMHDNLAKIMVGFAEATGLKTQRVTVSGLKLAFKVAQEVPARPTDQVAYFSMSEGSGATVADSNGTIATRYGTGDAAWYTATGCTRCPAIEFSGSGVLHANNSPATAPSASGTIAAWYYMPTRGTTDDGLVHKGNAANFADESYSLQLTGQRRMGLIVRYNASTTLLVDTSITTDTTWHHVAATWDADELRIYIDGEVKGRTANPNHYPAQASTGGLNIGAQGFDTATNTAINGFTGRISRVAIYNRALTAVEIAAMAVAP